MFDPFTKKRLSKLLDQYIENKLPKHVRDQLRLNYKMRGSTVTLFEERPAYKSEEWVQINVAQFRQDKDLLWKVYWQDSKDKWHWVEDIEPDTDFEKQLQQVDQDQRGMFWG